MRKGFKLALCGLGLFAIAGFGVGLSIKATNEQFVVVKAEGEGEGEGTEPETLPCQVVIDTVEHGSISVDIKEGQIGDICTITAKHDLLYKVDSVLVNGTTLVENEGESGKFSFALVEGENKVSAKFVVDEELCGTLTTIVQEAGEKDWTNLFTVENAIVLIKWVLDGGILIAMIRYYVKDKRLEKKLEDKVQTTVESIIPEATKKVVTEAFQKVFEPMVADIKADNFEIMRAMGVFAKCMALIQENTPESRRAILDELSGLKISDANTIDEVKRMIEEKLSEYTKNYQEALDMIKSIGQKNAEIVEKVESNNNKVEEKETVVEQRQAVE